MMLGLEAVAIPSNSVTTETYQTQFVSSQTHQQQQLIQQQQQQHNVSVTYEPQQTLHPHQLHLPAGLTPPPQVVSLQSQLYADAFFNTAALDYAFEEDPTSNVSLMEEEVEGEGGGIVGGDTNFFSALDHRGQ